MTTTAEMNGQASGMPQPDQLQVLEEQLTLGYKPTLPVQGMFNARGMPQMFLRQDTELMLTHAVVRQAMGYFKGGIAGAEFWGGPNPDDPEDEKGLPVCPENDQVGRFIKEQCERFWDRGVPLVQGAYEYGWVGCENIYDNASDVLKWEGLFAFSPGDTYLLTQDFKPIGVRVKNVQDRGSIDLWMAGDDVPAKGLWYTHQPRYGSFYGQSQLTAAWRDWRRLAWIDGAESVLDGAMYRFGYQGPLMRYPEGSAQGPSPGAANTTLDSQGNPRRWNRDIARMMGEQYKAGGVLGLPSERDQSGNYKWDAILPTGVMTGLETLINGCKHLGDRITQGIGVPPELLEASESGSGYSGRRIPLEAFLSNQQHIADAMLKLFVDQVLRPLVHWNFGRVKFNVAVKSLIKTRTKAAQAAGQGQQPQPGQPNANPQRNAQQGQPQPGQPLPAGHQHPNQAMFSHALVTDRIRDIARKIVRAA